MVNTIITNQPRITKESVIYEGNGLIINFISLLAVFGIYNDFIEFHKTQSSTKMNLV